MANNDEHVLSIIVRLRDAASKGVVELNKKLNEFENALRGQEEAYHRNIRASAANRAELQKQIRQLQAAKTEIIRLHKEEGKQVRDVQGRYASLDKAVESYNQKIRETQQELKRLTQEYDRQSAAINRARRNNERAIQNAGEIAKQADAQRRANVEREKNVELESRRIRALEYQLRVEEKLAQKTGDRSRVIEIQNEIDSLRHRQRALDGELTTRERLNSAYQRGRRAYDSFRHSIERLIVNEREWNEITTRSRRNNESIGRTIARLDNRFERFGATLRRTGDDLKRTERRLALMGRAMLGLVIAGVLIFMQSFLSSITALVGQVVALAGSLTFAAGVLGGSFAAAISQTIPLVALLAATMQRLSLIGDAINEQDKIRQQRAGQKQKDLKAEATANDAIADAQRAVIEAQQALNEARAEARREIEDLILAEREAELAAKRASLAYRDSRAALRDAVQSGDIGGLQNTELDVAEARLGRRRSNISLSRTRQEADAARRGGVEGMDRVIDATKRLADAQRNLDRAQRQSAESAANQTAAQERLAFIMEELSPIERRLVRQLIAFRDRIEEVFQPMTDTILESVSAAIAQFETLIFDERIINGFSRLADEVAHQIDRITAVFTDSRTADFWRVMLRESRLNLAPITDLFLNLAEIWMNISQTVAPVFRDILEDIVNLTGDWARETRDSTSVDNFFRTGLEHLRAWGRLLGELLGLWGDLMGVSGESALMTLDDLTGRLQDARENIRNNVDAVREFFNETSTAFGFLIDIVTRLGQAFINVFQRGGVESVGAFSRIIDQLLIPAFEFATIHVGAVVRLIDYLLHDLFGGALGQVSQFVLSIGIAIGQFRLLGGALLLLLRPMGAFIEFMVGRAIFATFAQNIRSLAVKALQGLAVAFSEVVRGLTTLMVTMSTQGFGAAVTQFIAGIRRMSRALRIALAGTAIGAVILGLDLLSGALGIFGSEQDQARSKIEEVTSALQRQKDALDALRDTTLDIKDARLAARSAALAAEDAERAYNQAKKEHGPNSKEAERAEIIWKQALIASERAQRNLNRAIRDAPDRAAEANIANAEAVETARDRYEGFREEVDKAREDIEKYEKALEGEPEGTRNYEIWQKRLNEAYEKRDANLVSLKQAEDDLRRAERRAARSKEEVTEATDESRRASRRLARALSIVQESLSGTSQTSRSLGEMLGAVTNNVLAAFGAKELKFALPRVAKVTSIIGRSLGFGGLFDAIEGGQTGGFFGHPNERGPDDRLIAVAGGEAILTGHQQQAANMAFAFANAAGVVPYASLSDLFANDRRPHATAPRGYQKGGIVPVPGFPGERINSKVLDTFLQLSKRFKLFLTDAYGPGHKSIEHTRLGTAIDVVPHPGMGGTWADVNRAVAYSVRRGFTPVYYDGSGGSINLPPHGPGHHAHITLLTASEYGSGMSPGSVGGGGFGFGTRIPRIKIRGPEGPLRDMLQGQSDKLRQAANRRIMEEIGAMGYHGPVNVPGNLYGVNELVRLWRSVNGDFGNARLMAAIAMAESSGNPAANGPPDGRGLWQVEWPIWGSTLGHLGNPYNPKANARMAGEILRRQGLSAWVVYNTGAYRQFMQRGGFVPQFDKGGVVPGPTGSPQLIMAHGGETVLPTHKYQTGGKVRNNLRSINRQLNRIGKTGVDSIDRLTNLLTALLRDGGLLDDLSTTLEQFVAAQSRRLNEWAYRVRRGGVAQIRSNTRIAEKQLDQLEDVGKFLNKEVDQIERAIRITRRKIQNADTAKERRRLRAALNNLIDRHGQISDALNQNLIERLNAQQAVFESIMARFDARLGINDLRQRILQAQGDISGDLDEEAMEKLLNRRGNILRDQRQEIRRELRRARRRGDRERALELRQALLENELALLENTKALQDLEGSIKETFDFNSTAWQQFRFAIFDGMGGLLPQFQIPQISTSGIITNVPQIGADSGNPVIPTMNNGDTNVYITEPMEVADPVALSNAIAFKLKTDKT